MQIKRQKGKYDCGVAVLSMITGDSFKVCRDNLNSLKNFGCLLSDLSRALRNKGIKNKISQNISPRCILRLQLDEGSHFVLFWDNRIYDPAKGIYSEIPENIKEILELTEINKSSNFKT